MLHLSCTKSFSPANLEDSLDSESNIYNRSKFTVKNAKIKLVMTLDRVAAGYLETKNYSQAKECYQQAIELTRELKDIEERQKQSILATYYYQLGTVAQELRQWDEARNNYQQALSIYIEYKGPLRTNLKLTTN